MPSVLILGAGPRIGLTVARAFHDRGYQIAIASRNATKYEGLSDYVKIDVDLKDPTAVESAFGQTKKAIGSPHVVIYNAAGLTPPKGDAFSVGLEQFSNDLQINVTSAYASLSLATKGFKELGESDKPKVFIVTGNILPFKPVPFGTTLGTGKAALAHLIQIGSVGYAQEGFRYYFASQVSESGGGVPFTNINADAHARVYTELAQGEKQDWDVRFVS